MPIYEFQCSACQHAMEALQKLSDAPLVDCPECGKPTLKKKISAAGFRLKGGGWYETDFKSSGQKNLAGDAGADKSSQDSTSSGQQSGAASTGKKSDGGTAASTD